jgi:hypothetical protein
MYVIIGAVPLLLCAVGILCYYFYRLKLDEDDEFSEAYDFKEGREDSDVKIYVTGNSRKIRYFNCFFLQDFFSKKISVA